MKKLTRREALKNVGLTLGGLALGTQTLAKNTQTSALLEEGSTLPTSNTLNTASTSALPLEFTPPQYPQLVKPITAITLGAGNRGNVYGGFSLASADELDIIGVAEPIQIRNERYAKKHNIDPKNCFKTWEDVFNVPKFADAILITMPDNLHYKACMKALELGYHVLLEKPIAQTEQECRDILAQAKRHKRIVAVCHVLRYAPYFIKLKQMISTGAVGQLMSIQHLEPISHLHMAHSYVRGNWRNSRETTPIILAKSCHDLDILRWLVGKPARNISAMGDLRWFTQANAPVGSSERCITCGVEEDCPYSALKIYKAGGRWNHVLDLPDDAAQHAEVLAERMKTSNYGRCVYQMDNDQCDHYITNIEFEDGITASFSMEAFTDYEGRRTRVMGSMGSIVGDMSSLTHTDFRTGKVTNFDAQAFGEGDSATYGHGGGDFGLARDWVHAIAANNPALLTSTIEASIESHIMGFAAEKSRSKKTVEPVRVN
jgi:predicted dehydrogenase